MCSACRVTIQQRPNTPAHSSCPYCGQSFEYLGGLERLETPLMLAVNVGVGAGRVRGERSSSEPGFIGLRLPQIVSKNF